MDEPTGPIERLSAAFGQLPGIGPKSAERMTHFLLADGRTAAVELAEALRGIVEQVHPCRECFNVTDGAVCSICADPRRDGSILCVVETPKDLAAMERIGSFKGKYHVLGGRLAPLDDIGPEKLTVDALLRRVQNAGVSEVILATNPNLEGDGTALYVSNVLASTGVRVTRLARGLPAGSSLELSNAHILSDALDGRRAF